MLLSEQNSYKKTNLLHEIEEVLHNIGILNSRASHLLQLF
jgi:hypothetical protein